MGSRLSSWVPLQTATWTQSPLSWIDACLDRERANLQVVERETPIRSNLVSITNASAHSSRRLLTLHLKSCSLFALFTSSSARQSSSSAAGHAATSLQSQPPGSPESRVQSP